MAASLTDRRGFLRGTFRPSKPDVMRPPQAAAAFDDLCTRCGDCAAACPEGILVHDHEKRPLVDVSLGACTFCGACADACPSGALDPALPPEWTWRAVVNDACLSMQGVLCRACEDVCGPRAIRFQLATGGRSSPRIDLDQCTGCGACAHTCPAQAVTFARHGPAIPEAAE